jgi:hypothetical protein
VNVEEALTVRAVGCVACSARPGAPCRMVYANPPYEALDRRTGLPDVAFLGEPLPFGFFHRERKAHAASMAPILAAEVERTTGRVLALLGKAPGATEEDRVRWVAGYIIERRAQA